MLNRAGSNIGESFVGEIDRARSVLDPKKTDTVSIPEDDRFGKGPANRQPTVSHGDWKFTLKGAPPGNKKKAREIKYQLS